MDNERLFTNLQEQVERNPLGAMIVATMFVGALTKLIKAHGDSAGSRAYAKAVNYKIKHDKKS